MSNQVYSNDTAKYGLSSQTTVIGTGTQNLIKFQLENPAASQNGIVVYDKTAPNTPLFEVGYDKTTNISYINAGIGSSLHLGTGDQETVVIEPGLQVDIRPRLFIAPFSGQTIGAVSFSYTHSPTEDSSSYLVEAKLTAYVTAGTAIGQAGVINRLTRMTKTGGVLNAVADLINTVSADAGINTISSNITASAQNIFVGAGGVAGQTIRWGGTVTIYQ